jgi:hypothetical protein
MTLSIDEFVRRFCLQRPTRFAVPIPPIATRHRLYEAEISQSSPCFRQVRRYGLYSNATKAKRLTTARRALGQRQKVLLNRAQRKELALLRLINNAANTCPTCKCGQLTTLTQASHPLCGSFFSIPRMGIDCAAAEINQSSANKSPPQILAIIESHQNH